MSECWGKLSRFVCLTVAVLVVTGPVMLRAEPLDRSKPYVVAVRSTDRDNLTRAGLEEELLVTVTNLELLEQDALKQKKAIVLYIDQIALEDIMTVVCYGTGATDELRFFISHSDGPINLWNHFVSTRGQNSLFIRKVSVSVGLADGEPIPTLVSGSDAFTLILVRQRWFVVCVALIGFLFVLFLGLAIKTDILREAGPAPEVGRKPYSLAVLQMAIWFFVIIASWLMLYVVKHTMNTLTEPLVMLMGISAGTGVGGVVIDINGGQKKRYSQGFLRDVLSDDYGISFHRFQVFAWTLVLVAVFVRQVTAYMTMPEFDTSLLVLMGISSGTYLGLKVTETSGNNRSQNGSQDNG